LNKRWIILGLLGAGLLLSYMALFSYFYANPFVYWERYWFAWIIFSIILYIAIAGATRPKRSELDVVTHSKEIINKKEVIVKVRCQYCNKLYDETLDNCPFCGGSR